MRSKKQIIRVFGIAAVTMVFTVALFGPIGVGAVDNPSAITPTISTPMLKLQGCEITMKTDKATYEVDEMPELKLEAFNPTNKFVLTNVRVSMLSSSPLSKFSRKMVIPTALWSGESPLALKPGEKKTFTLKPGVKLPAGHSIMLTMSDKKQPTFYSQVSVNAPTQTQKASPNSFAVTNGQLIQAPRIHAALIQNGKN